jgi:hypothetical protein
MTFRSEPFLWIHLAGIAIAPLSLQIVWLGLAVGDPLPFVWLELLFIVAIGILPVFWMQWQRPFDIFSLLFLALKPEKLTPPQKQILSLFKTRKQRILSLVVALGMSWILWQLYQLAPLAAIAASVLPQWRILGLLIAALAFLVSNLFVQVPVSVLGVLLTSEQQFSATEPYLVDKIPQQFTVPGLKVENILPTVVTRPPAKVK